MNYTAAAGAPGHCAIGRTISPGLTRVAAQLSVSGGCGWPAHSSGLETDSIVDSMPSQGVEGFKPQPQRLWLEYAEGPRRDSLRGAARLCSIREDYSDWQVITVTSPDGESFTIP